MSGPKRVANCARWLIAASVATVVPRVAEAVEPPAATAAAAPDVVLLKGGGMLRGTIAELVPGKRVVVVLITGEKRTLSMTEVDYAGPADRAPQTGVVPPQTTTAESPKDEAPQPSGEVAEPLPLQPKKRNHRNADADDEEEAPVGNHRRRPSGPNMNGTDEGEVSFASAEPGLLVYAVEESSGWRRPKLDSYRLLCTTPCSASLPVGRYRFGVATEFGSKPTPVDDPVDVNFGDTLHVDYTSNTWVRALGVGLMVAGTVGGLYMASNATGTDTKARTFATVAVASFGIGLGVLLVLVHDDAAVESPRRGTGLREPFDLADAAGSSSRRGAVFGLSGQF